jgi:cholesterol oxidase
VKPLRPMTTTLSFYEKLAGAFAWGETDPRSGAFAGKRAGIHFGFQGTIGMADLDKFIADPSHDASFDGVYLGNLFSSAGLPDPTFVEGSFEFMAPGPGAERQMIHKHVIESDGVRYTFEGVKHILDDPLAFDVIADLTTLYSTLKDPSGKIVAAGVLHFPMVDFPELVASFKSSGHDGFLVARLKFLKLFVHAELGVLLSGFEHPPAPKNRRRPLAKPVSERKTAYDVVIIGSGYGGGATAARLSAWRDAEGKGKSVCLLERGRDMRAGDFPEEPWQLAAEVRTASNPLGFVEVVAGGDINSVVGNGLGGTSLINANVMLRPRESIFEDRRWPKLLTYQALEPFYARAEEVIQPGPHPYPPVKAKALHQALENLQEAGAEPPFSIKTLPIAVNFEQGRKRAGDIVQDACTNCGGCVTGCNFAAKSTVDLTYLAIAEQAGAEIYAESEVVHLEGSPATGYQVHVRKPGSTDVTVIAAKQVIVAAGTFGSFRVLSESKGVLGIGDSLGTRFTGNGDVLGIGYDTHFPAEPQAGPTITTGITYLDAEVPANNFILEDGGLPLALTAVVRTFLPLVQHRRSPDSGIGDKLRDFLHGAADFVGLKGYGALRKSLVYLGMGREEDTGHLEIDSSGAVKVVWPGVGNEPFATAIDSRMEQLTFALGGAYVKNPQARSLLPDQLITAHPLGGCPMGDDPASSVVDLRGAVHGHADGLFVADGSIVPCSLELNPALTISALAEYVAAGIIEVWEKAHSGGGGLTATPVGQI